MWSNSCTGVVRPESKQALKYKSEIIFAKPRFKQPTKPVQAESLVATNPSKLATARVGSVVDCHEVHGRLVLRVKRDAGHLAGDVIHRLNDLPPVGKGEGAIKAILNHPSGP